VEKFLVACGHVTALEWGMQDAKRQHEEKHSAKNGIAAVQQELHLQTTTQFTTAPLSSATLGQVVNTHVPLSPSIIIWYQPIGGENLWLGR